MPWWPDNMDEIEVASLRRKGRKQMKGMSNQAGKRNAFTQKQRIASRMYSNLQASWMGLLSALEISFCASPESVIHWLVPLWNKAWWFQQPAPHRCVIAVHPYSVFDSNEHIQQQKLVKREDGRQQDPSVYMCMDLIPLPGNKPWHMVAKFCLI